MTHICVGKQTIIYSDNGLSPGRRQAIIWTNAGILLTGPLGTNFSEILIGIQIFSFKEMRLKMLSAKWRPFCLGLNELNLSIAMISFWSILTCFVMSDTINLNNVSTHLQQTYAIIRFAEVILCMGPSNERWYYNETSSFTGWAHTENNPCGSTASQQINFRILDKEHGYFRLLWTNLNPIDEDGEFTIARLFTSYLTWILQGH